MPMFYSFEVQIIIVLGILNSEFKYFYHLHD